jgi:CDP-diacylglycerol--glycerol-3-phosphate 3-phosphatidyltransferase
MATEETKPALNDHMAYGIFVVVVKVLEASWGSKWKDAKESREVPNALTQLRLLLTPLLLLFLILGFFYHPFWWVALGIWILGCASDYYDGKWSRGWDHVSAYGKYWDPVADKALTIPALLAFVVLGMMPFLAFLGLMAYSILYGVWWLVYTFRELRVTSLRNKFKAARPGDNAIAADNTGKIKTALVMVGGAVVILTAALGLTDVAKLSADGLNSLLLGTATWFAVYSWLHIYERQYKL